MISKGTFEFLSLKHANKNYFLRPDFILGVFQVDHSIKFKLKPRILAQLDLERQLDLKSTQVLQDCNRRIHDHVNRFTVAVQTIRRNSTEVASSAAITSKSEVTATSTSDDDSSSSSSSSSESSSGASHNILRDLRTSASKKLSFMSSRLPTKTPSATIKQDDDNDTLPHIQLIPTSSLRSLSSQSPASSSSLRQLNPERLGTSLDRGYLPSPPLQGRGGAADLDSAAPH
jgi:hypothetical protein